jgi:uncharacterized protein CbrC (UPF0167 family)
VTFWSPGWTGAPVELFPREIAGKGSVQRLDDAVACVACATRTSVGYAMHLVGQPTPSGADTMVPLCLACALVADSSAQGRSDAQLRDADTSWVERAPRP